MKKKRNVLKRNSGFIVGCMITAGVSFFAADVVMSQQMDLFTSLFETEGDSIVIEKAKPELAPESEVDKVYETDAFTVTAAGTVIKGVETEPITEADEPETTVDGAETGEQGEESGEGNSSESDDGSADQGSSSDGSANSGSYDDGSYDDGSYDDGSYSDGSYSDGSYDDGSYSDDYYNDNSYNDNSYNDNSSSGSNDWYDEPNIEIEDSDNGDHYYDDSWDDSNSNSGSNSDSSSGSNYGEPSDILLPGITTRYISESELYNYSDSMIRYIRNEIFAIHGRIFKSEDLREYFMSKSWYTPMYAPEDFDACMFSILNEYEKANLQVILKYEEALAAAN